jgi:hypothetical protein
MLTIPPIGLPGLPKKKAPDPFKKKRKPAPNQKRRRRKTIIPKLDIKKK